jgi:hypothetical protein
MPSWACPEWIFVSFGVFGIKKNYLAKEIHFLKLTFNPSYYKNSLLKSSLLKKKSLLPKEKAKTQFF